ncbi:Probable transmembrane protein [Candidatus Paraburkholderia kirkii UZHbot1]|uniref:Probable transmembrane protein n=1 Tax=Candidatus Paraburkholderia kirkii UZHbot1 TaxID=1055526 RepID=G4MEH3_9BURK|nr:Probable transmembrane protein [Candidatus Paraburkholderia kirkii UZHbot1]
MTEPIAPLRRRFVLAGLMSLLALALTSIAQAASNSIFPFIPDHYTFSTQQVQDAVARKFPLQRTASQIFDVVLSHPVVGMAADRNRVTVRVDARLSTPFIPNPVIGAFTLSTQLGYDAPSRSVILVSPSVDDAQYNQQIAAVGAQLAAQLLDRYPIHTFKPEELQFAGVSYEPGTITVLTNGIRVQVVEK